MPEQLTVDLTNRAKLVKKLAEIVKDIDHVEKRGVNTFHNYKYVKASDLANVVRDKLAAKNILLLSSVQKLDRYIRASDKGDQQAVMIEVEYVFYDGETGASLSFNVPGCGEDKGDKGIYKALTGSLKYAIRNAFLVPDESDPENDGKDEPSETDRIINAFRGFGVTVAMLEQKLGHGLDKVTDQDHEDLSGIYTALKNGTAGVDDFFKPVPKPEPSAVPAVNHTPAQPTDDPRPGEKREPKKRAAKAEPKPEPPTDPAAPPAKQPDPPATVEEKNEIKLRERLGAYSAVVGQAELKSFVLKYTGTTDTKLLSEAQWESVLKVLDAVAATGEEKLKALVLGKE